jgi:hypothetical protein
MVNMAVNTVRTLRLAQAGAGAPVTAAPADNARDGAHPAPAAAIA